MVTIQRFGIVFYALCRVNQCVKEVPYSRRCVVSIYLKTKTDWLKMLPHYSLITKHKSPTKNGASVHCTIETQLDTVHNSKTTVHLDGRTIFSAYAINTHTERENPL